MAQLASVYAAGSGLVGVILPDTTTSARYTSYDLPYLTQAFTAAGYKPSEFKIDNAAGTTTTELAIAQADITAGAKVLLVDPLDSTTGNQIQAAAAQAGIPMISYDRATFQGTNTYYVSFDNVQVGKLIGDGFNQCLTDWNVASPKVFTLDGGQDTDPNAIDFAKGYNNAVWGQAVAQVAPGATNAAGAALIDEQLTPGWDNAKGGTIFQQAYTAHPEINATIEANDGLAGAVITVLKAAGVPVKTIPTVGQDATLQGMEYVLQGWQCGSVYKPIYLEAQAAVALATYLRAGQTPPAGLVNGTTTDPTNAASTQPAVLLTPYWVNSTNMAATVIKDNFVDKTKLCADVGADVCTANGITAPSGSPAPSGSAPAGLTVNSFDASFSAMAQLASVYAAGSGLVGVILPDTTTSARYTSYDLPYLTQAFTAAGYKPSEFKIDNAAGTTTTELAIAQADITAGAKVLLVDPLDSTTGNQIQAAAAQAGIPMISYDRATFQGTNTYYVSFDNVQVGKLIGDGFNQCLTDWNVASPKVFTLDGGQDTDPNAIDFAKGYNNAVWGQAVAQVAPGATNAAGAALIDEQLTPGWDNAKGGTIFQQAYTAHPEINATIEANDGLAGAVITVLKAAGVPVKTIPTVGQDATLQGMEYVLQGWQCGSVYKPIYLEAQAAVALATYLRAGQTPPAGLVNGTTTDPTNAASTQPAVLLTPYWVNSTNMAATVIKDNFVDKTKLCADVGADVCTAAGIH
jgi:D-xylose transport system substrate-binding protein